MALRFRPQLFRQFAVRQLPPSLYALLGVCILGPLLRPGYILTLDMVFTPHLRMPAGTLSNSYLWYAGLHWLNLIIPADWLQKLMLLAIFTMAGWGMHLLTRLLTGIVSRRSPAPYLAGLCFVANPFVYDRFMTGQYGVLAGYALLPWACRALVVYTRQPGWRQLLAATAWMLALSIASIHSIVPMAILGMLVIGWHCWSRRRTPGAIWTVLRKSALVIALWVVASSYWLIPLAQGKGSVAQALGSFAGGDRAAFSTVGGNVFERLANVGLLQGFWAEDRALFVLPQAKAPAWTLLMFLLVALAFTGIYLLWRQGRRGVAGLLLGSIVSGAFLAAGIGNSWMAAHIPLFNGYREPQKFAMLVAFGYAPGIAVATAAGARWLKRNSRLPVTLPLFWVMVFLLPVLTASTLFWGARGQLQPTLYPDSWYSANQLLNHDSANFKSLFLPWHLYMYTDFAGRIIANPAPAFFDKPMIVSDDPELGQVAHTEADSLPRKTGEALARGPHSDHQLGQDLATLGIKYIVVANVSSDFLRYGYLARQSNITPIAKYDTLLVYKNHAYTSANNTGH